jgi:hypothetical protein
MDVGTAAVADGAGAPGQQFSVFLPAPQRAPDPPQAPTLEEIVAGAETGLAQAQIALETSRGELDRLTRMNHARLGPLYDRLDELDLLIVEARAALTGDPQLIRRAHEMRYGHAAGHPQADPLTGPLPEPAAGPAPWIDPEYTNSLRFTEPTPESDTLNPAKAVQRVYREVARRAHPDFAQDPVEKERRTAFIARVNDAYRRADLYELQRLAEEWTVISAPGPAADAPERQLWLRQRLIWLRARTAEAKVEREALLSSALGRVLLEHGSQGAFDALNAQLWDQVNVKELELQSVYSQTAEDYRPPVAEPPPARPAPASGFFG